MLGDLVLRRSMWDYTELAGLLKISFASSGDLLNGLGFIQDQTDGRLSRRSDDGATVRRDLQSRCFAGWTPWPHERTFCGSNTASLSESEARNRPGRSLRTIRALPVLA
jgi:hypothetical protein